jgi:hypothetical protein
MNLIRRELKRFDLLGGTDGAFEHSIVPEPFGLSAQLIATPDEIEVEPSTLLPIAATP